MNMKVGRQWLWSVNNWLMDMVVGCTCPEQKGMG